MDGIAGINQLKGSSGGDTKIHLTITITHTTDHISDQIDGMSTELLVIFIKRTVGVSN
jgi:hypothetical protein|tara:strand:+ start:865 stop:1038 length:174 start_codon:yes stop_codon:yes gene_type:complete